MTYERMQDKKTLVLCVDRDDDIGYKAQIESLMRSGYTTLWNSDQHLLQAHTCALATIMEQEADELGLVGIFKTNSQGKDRGSPNAFLFPLTSLRASYPVNSVLS